MSSTFPSLAIELIELIATFLELADISSLRLVSRELNRKTLNTFGLANFATIQTDLSYKSLERLQSISKSEHFALHVRRLGVKQTPSGIIGQGFDWPRHSSGCLAENLQGADLLREILSQRLLSCRSFLIHSYDECGPHHDIESLVPSDAVGLVLSIVAKTGLPLRSFIIQSNHNGNGRLDTPRLQMPLSQTSKFVKAWSQIEELVLHYGITSDQYEWVLHLCSSALRLRKLSLTFDEGDASFLQQLSSLHGLNRLEELEIGGPLMVTMDAITLLLSQNRDNLHSLSLSNSAMDDESKWSTLFENMKDQLPQLRNLVLFWLKQGTESWRIAFSKLRKYPVVPGSEIRGPNQRLKYDSRQIESIECPIRLRYWGIGQMVVGVEYHGKGINHILSVLADTVEMI